RRRIGAVGVVTPRTVLARRGAAPGGDGRQRERRTTPAHRGPAEGSRPRRGRTRSGQGRPLPRAQMVACRVWRPRRLAMRNTLYYGDNLAILRDHIADESVDLIYLDPPFNSARSYNVLFKHESGDAAEAQVRAFDDTWHWGQEAEHTYHELVTKGLPPVADMIGAMRQFIGDNQMMAYLVMKAARLAELHRVLNPTGSLYLHCDPTASHYLRIILDTVFGPRNMRSEIIWKRSAAHNDAKQGAKQPGRIHDVILFYSKHDDNWTWNQVYTAYDESYMESNYRYVDETTGRRY